MSKVMDILEQVGVIPVVVIENENDAIPLIKAMKAGGIPVAEVTLRTPAALGAIRQIAALADSDIVVGAGSVTTIEQCREAVRAGAQFIVSPGFCEDVVKFCVEHEVDVVPAALRLQRLLRLWPGGINTVKFFPANIYGGLSAMKALNGPFPRVSFVPTGGVNGDNLKEYLKAPYIRAVGGSWICSKKDISNGDFDHITALCREARESVDSVRNV